MKFIEWKSRVETLSKESSPIDGEGWRGAGAHSRKWLESLTRRYERDRPHMQSSHCRRAGFEHGGRSRGGWRGCERVPVWRRSVRHDGGVGGLQALWPNSLRLMPIYLPTTEGALDARGAALP